jgi:hypothetical protein
MKLDPVQVRHQIDALLVQYPELKEDEEAWLMSLESETDFDNLLRQLERRRQEATCMFDAIKLNICELQARQVRFERRVEAMRATMFKLLEWAKVRKKELPEATLSIRAGTQKVVVTDDALIPDELCRFKREVDKVKLKEVLQETGPLLNGGAYLSNAEPTLSIRTK